MKTLRQLCATLILTLALTLSALAGEMSTSGITGPPPPPPDSQATTTNDISTSGVTGDMGAGVTATDPATEVVLSLVQGLLSLF